MPRIYPYPLPTANDNDDDEDKFKHACPRLKKWKTRFDEADGDINRIRIQAINKSPVYVAIQRGSRNIQIRTKTNPRLWRMWIQQGRRIDDDDLMIEPQQFSQNMIYKYQKQVSFTTQKSPQRTPRKTVPVTPIKSPKKSPVKVSILRAETDSYVGDKFTSSKYNVPTLTLTPVPLNTILKKKAKIVGKISSLGKGRWIDQDSSLLSVPGHEPFGYETSSETEDDESRERKAEIIKMIKHQTPPSPTETIKKKIEHIRRRESQMSIKQESPVRKGDRRASPTESVDSSSPTKGSTKSISPPKSPTKSPPKSPTKSPPKSITKSPSQQSTGSTASRDSLRKVRGVGHASALLSSPKKHDEQYYEGYDEEYFMNREPLTKDQAIRKIKAVGQSSLAFSPRKGPEIAYEAPTETEEDTEGTDEHEPRKVHTPEYIKSKMRAIGQTSAMLSPRRRGGLDSDQEQTEAEQTEQEQTDEFSDEEPIKSSSGLNLLMTKIRFLGKISPKKKKKDDKPDEENATGMSLLMTKIRFLTKLSPKRKMKSVSEEEEIDTKKLSPMGVLMKKIGFLAKISPKKEKKPKGSSDETDEEPQTDDEQQKKIKTSDDELDEDKKPKDETLQETKPEDQEHKEGESKSFFKKICPCIGRKKEPELMEFQSGSQVMY